MAEKETASVIDFGERHRAQCRKRFTPMFGPQEKTVTFVAPQVDDEHGEPLFRICMSITVATGDVDSMIAEVKQNGGIGLPWDFDEILVSDTEHIISRVEVEQDDGLRG